MTALSDRLAALSARLAAAAPRYRSELAARIEAAGVALGELPVPAADRSGPLPASEAQRRLWFLWRLDPASSAYAVGGGLLLTGPLDASALEAAFDDVAGRHEALRTRFEETADGAILQKIDPEPVHAFETRDLSALDEEAAEAEVARLAREAIETPFDLIAGPLLRVMLVRLGEERHALITALHHIVCDAWSLDVMTSEVSEAYRARSAGEAPALDPAPLQFSDWAAWRDVLARCGALDAGVEAGRRALEAAPRVVELPERETGALPVKSRARRLPVAFDARHAQAVKWLGSALGATAHEVLLAAFAVFLARSSGRAKMIVGLPVANRGAAATHGAIGPFVNTVALPLAIETGKKFSDVVGEVAAASRAALSRQDLPFERVAEGFSGDGDAPFNVMFGFQRAALPPRFPGCAAERLPAAPSAAKLELILGVEEAEDGSLAGALILSEARFSQGAGERLRDRFVALLEGLLAAPEKPCREADLLPRAERAFLAAQNVRPQSEAFVPFHLRVAEVAAADPDRLAIVCGDVRLSYGELNARANALAHELIRRGAGREKIVAVLMGRTAEAFVAILGVMKSGAAYLPLDPEAPRERLISLAEDAGARLLVTERAMRNLTMIGAPAILMDDCASAAADPDVEIRPDQLAYVIFTSGSTGRPKGVAVAHGPLAMHAFAIADRYGLLAEDRVLHVISLSFDAATEAFAAPLAAGASIVLGDARAWTATDALDVIRREGVTIVGMSPALLSSIAEAHETSGKSPLPVRSWTAGGEAFSVDAFLACRRSFWPARIINGYGPTETVITPLLFRATAETSENAWGNADWLPIGSPVGDRTAFVLDEDLSEVGIGVPGELYVGGSGLARGYVGAPEITASRFVPDPFGPAGSRLYRTGDRVRRRADGALDYLGRIDAQIKIRGFRIEPGEVEAQLLSHPGCREAAVAAAERDGGAHLVAYVSGDAREDELARHLAERLPAHMRPSLIQRLAALPRLASGKIDRNGLPDPEWRARDYEAPETETERALAALWSDLLGVDKIGRADGFFELGGHSLLAAKLVARIRSGLGRDLALRSAFVAPTLSVMASRVEAAPPVAGGEAPILPAPRGRPAPATDMQLSIWRWQQAHPGSGGYNVFGASRLAGPLDPDRLRRAIERVAARHDAFRTTFREIDGRLKQLVDETAPLAFGRIDLSGLPALEREARAAEAADACASQPFDLERDTPFRVVLIRLHGEDHVLAIAAHHIVSDGRSMEVFLAEAAAGHASDAGFSAPPALQLADYAAWRAELPAQETERRLAAAEARLSGLWRSHPVPTDHPRGSGTRGGRIRFELASPVVEKLRRACLAQGATLPMAALTALAAALRARSDIDGVAIGLLTADRDRPELEHVVGCLVETELAVARIDLSLPFERALTEVRDDRLAARSAGLAPFERLKASLEASGRLRRGLPTFQSVFNYRRAEPLDVRLGCGIEARPFPAENPDECFELEFDFVESASGLSVGVGWLAASFEAGTVASIGQDLVAILTGAAEDSSRPFVNLMDGRASRSSPAAAE